MPMNPRLLRPTTSGLDKDAAIYLNAVAVQDGQQLEPAVKKAINDFVKGCKQDGIWDAINSACILSGARTLNGALVALKGTAPTNNNFVSADYDRETGLKGNASTKFLNTNVNSNAFPQNSFHTAVYASAVGSGVQAYAGAGLNSTGSMNFYTDGGGGLQFRNRTTAADTLSGVGSTAGLIGTSRSASGSFVSRGGGTSQTTSFTSETPVNANVYIFSLNNGGSSSFATAGRLAFYSVGESLNLGTLDTRVKALYDAIGAAI